MAMGKDSSVPDDVTIPSGMVALADESVLLQWSSVSIVGLSPGAPSCLHRLGAP